MTQTLFEPPRLNAGNTSEALIKKWRSRIDSQGEWWRLYGFTMASLIYLAMLFARYRQDISTGGWSGLQTNQVLSIGVAVMLVLFILVRAHLASIPAMVVRSDWLKSRWESFRATPAHPDDLVKAMLALGFSYSAVPIALVSTIETVLFLTICGGGLIIYTWSQIPLILVMYLAYGLCLIPIAYFGAAITKNVLGIYGFAILPAIIGLALTGPRIKDDLTNIVLSNIFENQRAHLSNYLVFPERLISFTGSSFTRQGFTIVPGVDSTALMSTIVAMLITAAFLWVFMWLIMRWKLRVG